MTKSLYTTQYQVRFYNSISLGQQVKFDHVFFLGKGELKRVGVKYKVVKYYKCDLETIEES